MNAKKAMVSKIKHGHCIIVTDDGQFKRIPLPRNPVRVGQIIDYKEPLDLKWFKPILMVASFFIVFIGLYAYQQSLASDPLTYLTIDINPSIQLGLDSSDNVIKAVPLNGDGEKVLDKLNYKDRSYDAVVEDLVAEAANQGFLASSEDNVIVASLYNQTPTSLEKAQEEKVRRSIGLSLDKKKLKAKVMVYKVDKKVWQEAKKTGLSAGKYAFSMEMKAKGIEISNTELKNNSIKNILKSRKMTPQEDPEVNYLVYAKPIITEQPPAPKQWVRENKKPAKLIKLEKHKYKKPILTPTVTQEIYDEQPLIEEAKEEPQRPFQQKKTKKFVNKITEKDNEKNEKKGQKKPGN